MCCQGFRNVLCNGIELLALARVQLQQDAFLACRYHALLATRFALKFPDVPGVL